MAKKRNGSKYELDDYGFSSDLDMSGFDFKVPEVKDDRKAATKLVGAFAGGFKDQVTSPTFIRKVLKDVLPKSYGSAFDFADEASGTLRSLYDNASKEIKPAYNDLKRTTARVLPKADKYLPRAVASRIKKWSEQTYSSGGISPDQQREADLMLQLGDVFKFQAEDSLRRDAEGDAKDKLREGMAQMRHRDSLAQLDAIRQAVSQTNAYTLGVTSKVQRKSLELQFRQYFVQRDTLTEMKRFNTLHQGYLEQITKNTGLPDFDKVTRSEKIGQFMRNRFAGMAGRLTDGMFDRRKNFISNLGKNISSKAMGSVRNAAGGLQQGLMGVEMGMDGAELAASMGEMGGPSTPEMLAGMAGQGAAELAAWGFGKKVGKFLTKGRLGRMIQTKGNQSDLFFRNLPQRAADFSKTQTDYAKHGRIKSFLIDLAKDFAGSSLGSTNNTMDVDKAGELHQVSPWTRQSSKTLNEIIPGFLARIYQELQIMRTGDSKVELTTYDLTKNGFTTRSQASKNAWNAAFRSKGYKGSMMQVNNLIDKIGGQSLSPEQREELGRKLVLANLSGSVGKHGSKDFFTNPKSFGGGANGQLYAKLFADHFAGDQTFKKQNDINRRFTDLGKYTSDMRNGLQNQINLGMLDFLQESGAVDPATGRLNMDKVYGYYYGDEFDPTAQHAGGPVAKGRAGGSKRTVINNRTVNQTDARDMSTANYGLMSASQGLTAPQELLEAVRENNLRKEAGVMMESVLRIEQLLGHGIVTFNQQEAHDGTKAKDPGWGWNMSLRQASRKALKGLGHSVVWAAKGANQLASSLIGGSFRGVGSALSLGGKVANVMLDKARGIKDVFVPGEQIPRMDAGLMKAGEYTDVATGKVIKTFKDIRGEVKDSKGKTVLTAEEAKTAYVKYGIVRKSLSALASLIGITNKGMGKLLGAIGGGLGTAKDIAKRGLSWLLAEPQDVFRKDKMDTPKLFKSIMAGGGYRSKQTSRVIKHPGMIDGPVLDEDGNQALSLDDIRAGLVNRFGKPLRNNLGAILGGAGWLANKAVSAVMGAAKWAGKLVGGGLKGLGGMLSNFRIPGLSIFDSRETNDILVDIRDILDNRLPGGGLFGGGGGNWGDGGMEGKSRTGKTGGWSDAGAEGGGGGKPGAPGAPGGAAGTANKGSRTYRAGKAMGTAGRAIKGFGKGAWEVGKSFMATGAGKMLGVAGAGLGAYSAYENVKQGNYGSAAMDAGLAGLSLAASGVSLGGMATAAGAAGSGLLAAGAWAAGGIAALLASPVVLGALAVGAVAGLGYLGYKYFSRKKLGDISKLRYAQYGFAESDTDHLQAIFGLEDKLKSALVWGAQGPELDGKKMDGEDIAKDFGVDTKNAKQVNQFIVWFHNRFKPVFLTHVAGLKAVAPDKWLDSVDDLKGGEKKRYFELTKFEGGPFNVMTTPFIGGKDLEVDASAVAALTAKIAEDVAKEKTDDAGKDGLGNTAAAAAGAAAGAVVGAGAVQGQSASSSPTGSASGAPTPSSSAGAIASSASGLTVKASFGGFARRSGGEMDALTVIRFKTYGLQQMVTDKARALDQLESEVAKKLVFDGKNVASFQGSAEEMMAKCGAAFGVQDPNSDNGANWSTWFTMRFLPVFLNYATALAQATGRQDPQAALQAMKDNDAVDVAQAVYSTAVWGLGMTPWPGYVLNSEVRSVEANFQALKEKAKKNVADEQVGSKPGKVGQDNGGGVSDGTTGTGKGGFAAAAAGMWDKATGFLGKIGSAIGEKLFNATHDQPSNLGSGSAVQGPSQGTGGAMADLPMPKGSGKYEYFQELFERVGKIVGVDPKLMATMAAIESGFNPSVRARSSSATGLFQFVDGTWNTMMRKYGAKFGIPQGTPSTDPRANALLGAAYMKENMAALQGVRPQISDTDVYMAHFLGAGGAKKFFKAAPGDIAASVMPEAAQANLPIFYNPNGTPRTVAEVYAFMNDKIRKRGQQFGLDAGTGTMAQSTGPTATPETSKPVPVTEQVATPVANTGPAAAPAAANAPETQASPVDPASQGGFNPQPPSRMADVAMTQQANRDETAKSMGDLTTVAQQQLGVQTDMLGVLGRIERLLLTKFAQAGGSTSEQQAASQAATRPTRDMPTPPVSMAKAG